MKEQNQKISLVLCAFLFFSCNNSSKDSSKTSVKNEKSFERHSELGFEKFTLKFTDDKNFDGTQFSILKKVDTVTSKIKGVLDNNGVISFIAEKENQSVEYLGRLEDEKLVLYTSELNFSGLPLNKYTIKNKKYKLDSVEYKITD